MAEIKLSDLPLMTEAEFTANDRFVMVDDGNARAMPKTVFDSWVANNVQGEKGEQGVQGRDGKDGINGTNGVDGEDGLSAYQIALSQGFVGTQAQWLASLKGATGAAGLDGFNGWSPVLKTVARGIDIVLQIHDWVGGTGTKPTTIGYVGDSGIVTNIANATNIKGAKGDKGDTGEQGIQGESGTDAKTIDTITFNPDASIVITYTDATSVTSETPPKTFGWGVYRDGQYSQTSPLTIAVGNQVVLPNNAVTKIENMPSAYTSFYNPTTQKYLLQDEDGWYTIRVKFKVAASNQPSYLTLSMSDGTTQLTYIEDKSLRGDSQIQYVDLTCEQYGNSALASNGLSISVKAFDRSISMYDVEVSVAKII